jgi:hypothetical protein
LKPASHLAQRARLFWQLTRRRTDLDAKTCEAFRDTFRVPLFLKYIFEAWMLPVFWIIVRAMLDGASFIDYNFSPSGIGKRGENPLLPRNCIR